MSTTKNTAVSSKNKVSLFTIADLAEETMKQFDTTGEDMDYIHTPTNDKIVLEGVIVGTITSHYNT